MKKTQNARYGEIQRNKLIYKHETTYRARFSNRKKDRMGYLLRQIASYSRILHKLQADAAELRLYKNRIRDCEYEIYKMRNLLKEKGLADDAFLNDALK